MKKSHFHLLGEGGSILPDSPALFLACKIWAWFPTSSTLCLLPSPWPGWWRRGLVRLPLQENSNNVHSPPTAETWRASSCPAPASAPPLGLMRVSSESQGGGDSPPASSAASQRYSFHNFPLQHRERSQCRPAPGPKVLSLEASSGRATSQVLDNCYLIQIFMNLVWSPSVDPPLKVVVVLGIFCAELEKLTGT